MACEEGDRCSSIAVPLLLGDNEKVNASNVAVPKTDDDVDRYSTVHVAGKTSSFKTCFHLVNAISGSIPLTSFLINASHQSLLCRMMILL